MSSRTYKGKYRPTDLSKYRGDPTSIIYRSLWERNLMRFCDANSKVIWWSSEPIAIPYRCATDGKIHRYFPDFLIHFTNGETYCIEVKPEKETIQPVKKRGKRKAVFITEALTYAKNVSKWEAAQKYCKQRGWRFEIWHEKILEALGIKILTAGQRKRNK